MLHAIEQVARRLIGRALGVVYATVGLLLLLLWACSGNLLCTIVVLIAAAVVVVLHGYVFRPLMHLARIYRPRKPPLLGVVASGLGVAALMLSVGELVGLPRGLAVVFGASAAAVTLLLLAGLALQPRILGPPEYTVAATLAATLAAHMFWREIALPIAGTGMLLAGALALWSHYLRPPKTRERGSPD